MTLEVGQRLEMEWSVDATNTADAIGNPGMHVLATPWLIAYFEIACHRLLEPALRPGQATVGTAVNIEHLAASPVGMRFTVRAEITDIDRRRILFSVVAHDQRERIGEGTHERFIVESEQFQERVGRKLGS